MMSLAEILDQRKAELRAAHLRIAFLEEELSNERLKTAVPSARVPAPAHVPSIAEQVHAARAAARAAHEQQQAA